MSERSLSQAGRRLFAVLVSGVVILILLTVAAIVGDYLHTSNRLAANVIVGVIISFGAVVYRWLNGAF